MCIWITILITPSYELRRRANMKNCVLWQDIPVMPWDGCGNKRIHLTVTFVLLRFASPELTTRTTAHRRTTAKISTWDNLWAIAIAMRLRLWFSLWLWLWQRQWAVPAKLLWCKNAGICAKRQSTTPEQRSHQGVSAAGATTAARRRQQQRTIYQENENLLSENEEKRLEASAQSGLRLVLVRNGSQQQQES